MAGGGRAAMLDPEIDLAWEGAWRGEAARGGEESTAAFFLCRASFSLKVSRSGLNEEEDEGGDTDPSGMGAAIHATQQE